MYSGTNNQFYKMRLLTDHNFFSVLNAPILFSNFNPNRYFFQTKPITQMIHSYLHSITQKTQIINKNPFGNRYKNNQDIFVHIRLGDMSKYNPGLNYYIKTIYLVKKNNIENGIGIGIIYLSTDQKNHILIKKLQKEFPLSVLIEKNEIETFQFGSACQSIVLSHGSFSAIIGYLGFYSKIYYPKYDSKKKWYGDMFSIDGWVECE